MSSRDSRPLPPPISSQDSMMSRGMYPFSPGALQRQGNGNWNHEPLHFPPGNKRPQVKFAEHTQYMSFGALPTQEAHCEIERMEDRVGDNEGLDLSLLDRIENLEMENKLLQERNYRLKVDERIKEVERENELLREKVWHLEKGMMQLLQREGESGLRKRGGDDRNSDEGVEAKKRRRTYSLSDVLRNESEDANKRWMPTSSYVSYDGNANTGPKSVRKKEGLVPVSSSATISVVSVPGIRPAAITAITPVIIDISSDADDDEIQDKTKEIVDAVALEGATTNPEQSSIRPRTAALTPRESTTSPESNVHPQIHEILGNGIVEGEHATVADWDELAKFYKMCPMRRLSMHPSVANTCFIVRCQNCNLSMHRLPPILSHALGKKHQRNFSGTSRDAVLFWTKVCMDACGFEINSEMKSHHQVAANQNANPIEAEQQASQDDLIKIANVAQPCKDKLDRSFATTSIIPCIRPITNVNTHPMVLALIRHNPNLTDDEKATSEDWDELKKVYELCLRSYLCKTTCKLFRKDTHCEICTKVVSLPTIHVFMGHLFGHKHRGSAAVVAVPRGAIRFWFNKFNGSPKRLQL